MSTKDLKEVTSDGKVKITINIPKKILLQMDEDRKITNHTRSSWITTAVMERLGAKKKI
jgi:metal-responsive CopG/Arc/MetJ family transcriptional regulator